MVDCNGMDKLLEICISTLDEIALQKKRFPWIVICLSQTKL